jgi:hypothetical protein
MIAFDFNGEKLQPTSTEEVSGLLGRVDKSSMFELWATVSNGPSLCMRRNGGDAWLMYLRQEGGSGLSVPCSNLLRSGDRPEFDCCIATANWTALVE